MLNRKMPMKRLRGLVQTLRAATLLNLIKTMRSEIVSTAGSRRRQEKSTTPQRGMNKKEKARSDLTNDDSSEEEITFEDCQSITSSKDSTTRPSGTSAESATLQTFRCQTMILKQIRTPMTNRPWTV
jgi:hypothetical protein